MRPEHICPYSFGLSPAPACLRQFHRLQELAAHIGEVHLQVVVTFHLRDWESNHRRTCWCGKKFSHHAPRRGWLSPLAKHLKEEGGAVTHYLAVKFGPGICQEKEHAQ